MYLSRKRFDSRFFRAPCRASALIERECVRERERVREREDSRSNGLFFFFLLPPLSFDFHLGHTFMGIQPASSQK